jgi:hypothetical protein
MERRREVQGSLETAAQREHAMILAFALAIVGAVVLGSLELAARFETHHHAAPVHAHGR